MEDLRLAMSVSGVVGFAVIVENSPLPALNTVASGKSTAVQ
jgi:hypothetical protein